MFKFLLLILLISPVSASIILEVCPNPYDPNSEYVKVFVDSNCTLTDGEGSITFNRTGTFYVAKNSTAFERSFGFPPDYEFKGRFALSNSGEKVWIVRNGKILDEFSWKNADKGLIYYRTDRGWDFRYEDWTDFDSVRDYVSGSVIVSPANYRIKANSIVLASYTLTDPSSIDCDNLTIFLDGNVVGGIPANEMTLPGDVHFLRSNSYRHFHWKFAVADGDRVVITTENWNFNKRGYIVEFKSEKIAKYLLSVLDHDRRYEYDVKKFSKPRHSFKSFKTGKIVKFESQVEVFVLPDCNPVLKVMRSAKKRLLIQAPYLGVEWKPLLKTIENVSKHVRTKIILNDDETKEFLEKLARSKDLKLEVRKMESLHGKMIVADDVALITSANLNEYGLERNREVGILIYDKKVADFLANSFEEDWSSGRGNVCHLLVAVTVLAVALLLAHRKLR